jgi:hypothetical protein
MKPSSHSSLHQSLNESIQPLIHPSVHQWIHPATHPSICPPIQSIKKGLQALRSSKKSSVNIRTSRDQCLMRYGRWSCDLCSRCSMWFPCISTQLSEMRTLSKFLVSLKSLDKHSLLVTVINNWLTLNTPKHQSFRCPHSQKFWGLWAGVRAG